ncbi:AAA family ATPase [Aquiflexum sp. TKW24L]|uniref:AAA family ATPase n=1 Tax=Aquiflexum sp. TKW24L TaxID=2942212 RepID=UPI0020C13392|nr:AAA family ATPase [Aquiflexum sp. TKW24L]MCL6258496.1 AAA family ATPase [Aquiflexum sp. TKW24L]
MGQSLIEIAHILKDADKKLQLIYAFNGSGKTRLSRQFKELIAPKELDVDQQEESGIKILYYNAFTEDLFYWDNDLESDSDRKLKIQPNSFTDWVLREQGQDRNIIENFQQLTNDRLTPQFNEDFTEVRFSFERGNEGDTEYVKISKGEESCFIWSVFFSLMEQVVSVLNIVDQESRETPQYNNLKYIFIDDPVSSLDDTHLIELAVNISELIKSSTSDLKFIITTHNPLFYNVLFNEFNRVRRNKKWLLEKLNDGTFSMKELESDSPFSYHLFLLSELEKAIQPTGEIKKFHFNFLRNLLEKTSTFLGYNKWEDLLPQESREAYYRRIINLSSHSRHNGEEISIVEENDKRVLGFLVNEIKRMYGFKPTINTSTPEGNVAI